VIADARIAAWFPRATAGYCLDPNADVRAFGAKGQLPLGEAADLFTLDRERLERLELEEVVTASYVEDRDEPARVAATVLRFASVNGATAFFTDRLAEAAEVGRPVWRSLDAGAAGVLGDSTALALRAQAVVRLDFSSRGLPPQSLASAAAPVLTALARAMANALPGKAELPAAARLLPEAGRVPLSLRFSAPDLLGWAGVGPGAFATYGEGGGQHLRLALFAERDADSAEDVLRTLRKRAWFSALKHAPYDATRVVELDPKSGVGVEWIFGQKGALVAGASLDAPPRAAPRGSPPERDRAVLEMKRLLDGLHGPAVVGSKD
jgi:hypothetical protein